MITNIMTLIIITKRKALHINKNNYDDDDDDDDL